jgi:hypothetical protein
MRFLAEMPSGSCDGSLTVNRRLQHGFLNFFSSRPKMKKSPDPNRPPLTQIVFDYTVDVFS